MLYYVRVNDLLYFTYYRSVLHIMTESGKIPVKQTGLAANSWCITSDQTVTLWDLTSVRENVWGNSKKRKKSCFFWILKKNVTQPIVSQAT